MAIKRADFESWVGAVCGCLTVVALIPPRSKIDNPRFFAYCSCGGETVISFHHLKNKKRLTCGCRGSGETKVSVSEEKAIRNIWWGMMFRCYNEKCVHYQNYGGRGIIVAERWHDFDGFFSDMGLRPGKNFTLERIDNSSGYRPDNVRWAIRADQAANRRSSQHMTAFGKTQILQQWAREYGLNQNTIKARLRKGGALEDCLYPPGSKKRPAGKIKNADAKHVFTYKGKTQSLQMWARDLGVEYRALWQRMKRGSPIEDILSPKSLHNVWLEKKLAEEGRAIVRGPRRKSQTAAGKLVKLVKDASQAQS